MCHGLCPTAQPTFLPSPGPCWAFSLGSACHRLRWPLVFSRGVSPLLGETEPSHFPPPHTAPSLLPLSVQWLLQRCQPFLPKRVGWSWGFPYPDGPEPFASRPGLTLGFWCSFQMGSSMSSKPCCFPGIARNQLSASSWGGRETDLWKDIIHLGQTPQASPCPEEQLSEQPLVWVCTGTIVTWGGGENPVPLCWGPKSLSEMGRHSPVPPTPFALYAPLVLAPVLLKPGDVPANTRLCPGLGRLLDLGGLMGSTGRF